MFILKFILLITYNFFLIFILTKDGYTYKYRLKQLSVQLKINIVVINNSLQYFFFIKTNQINQKCFGFLW